MKVVADDHLVSVLRCAGRGGAGVTHLHRHGFDPGSFVGGELVEEAVQAGLAPFVCQVL